jgi:hypothetical protein
VFQCRPAGLRPPCGQVLQAESFGTRQCIGPCLGEQISKPCVFPLRHIISSQTSPRVDREFPIFSVLMFAFSSKEFMRALSANKDRGKSEQFVGCGPAPSLSGCCSALPPPCALAKGRREVRYRVRCGGCISRGFFLLHSQQKRQQRYTRGAGSCTHSVGLIHSLKWAFLSRKRCLRRPIPLASISKVLPENVRRFKTDPRLQSGSCLCRFPLSRTSALYRANYGTRESKTRVFRFS